jgi:hypothetical protein
MAVLLMLAPDHARLIADAGWSKDDIRQFMFYRSRRSWGELRHLVETRKSLMSPSMMWLWSAPDNTMLPIVKDPSYFDIVVVGGDAGKSAVALQIGSPATAEIVRE